MSIDEIRYNYSYYLIDELDKCVNKYPKSKLGELYKKRLAEKLGLLFQYTDDYSCKVIFNTGNLLIYAEQKEKYESMQFIKELFEFTRDNYDTDGLYLINFNKKEFSDYYFKPTYNGDIEKYNKENNNE